MNSRRIHENGVPTAVDEGEMIHDYFDFLGQVQEVAEHDDTSEGKGMYVAAKRFAHETTYMSVEDMRTAIRGMAYAQTDYLTADSERQLLFYLPERSAHNSPGKITEDIVSYMKASAPDVADRVAIVGGASYDTSLNIVGLDPDKTKVALIDDWSVSGNLLSNEVAHAQQYFEASGASFLRPCLEIDLLLARSDQIQDSFAKLTDVEEVYGIKKPIPVRTYFTANAVPNIYDGPTPTGAHSAVDYGFATRLEEMRNYLAEKLQDDDILLPHIATVVRESH